MAKKKREREREAKLDRNEYIKLFHSPEKSHPVVSGWYSQLNRWLVYLVRL